MTVAHSAYVGGLTGIVKRRRRGTGTVLVVSFVAGALFNLGMVAALAALARLEKPDLRRDHRQHQRDRGRLDGDRALRKLPFIPAQRTRRERAPGDGPRTPMVPRRGVALLAVADLGQRHRLDHGRVLDRLVGAVAGAGSDARYPRCATRTGCAARQCADRADPAATTGGPGPLPLSEHRPRRAAPGQPGGQGRRTFGHHRSQRFWQDNADAPSWPVREPTSGAVDRPGAVGLGRLGGTAVVMQHPESQVLGTRVADDVVWGLPPGTAIDVGRLLSEVGLESHAERDTGSLSGGELQRLAVAAALAREPALLIADEVTSMVDQQGRDALLSVLSGLRNRHRAALVHITHYNNEADSADRSINLSESGDNTGMVETMATPVVTPVMGSRSPAPRSSRSPVSGTNTVAGPRGPRPHCAMSALSCSRGTGC